MFAKFRRLLESDFWFAACCIIILAGWVYREWRLSQPAANVEIVVDEDDEPKPLTEAEFAELQRRLRLEKEKAGR